jgi:hypothetical protein
MGVDDQVKKARAYARNEFALAFTSVAIQVLEFLLT